MKIQTYSIVAGSKACNASCPYCVSKMTPSQGIEARLPDINWRNFDKGCRLAKDFGVSTVLITGKGEPALFPEQITEYMKRLVPYDFPLIELQTNGISIYQKRAEFEKHLQDWYDYGMTTVAVSIAHYENEKNKEIFQPHGDYMDLSALVDLLHNKRFSVRLSCVMVKGFIEDSGGIEKLVEYAKENKVEQLTVRHIEKPESALDTKGKGVYDWVREHKLDLEQLDEIKKYLDEKGTRLMMLVHGAVVYDLHGQNICLTNALTIDPDSEDVRQLIFFPDGHLRYDWQYPGAILL